VYSIGDIMKLGLVCVLLLIASGVVLVSAHVYDTLDYYIDQETMTPKEKNEMILLTLIIGVPLMALFWFGSTLRG